MEAGDGDTPAITILGDGMVDITTTGDGAMAEALIETDTVMAIETVLMMAHGAVAGRAIDTLETVAREAPFTLEEQVRQLA